MSALGAPRRQEIDVQQIKFLIGLIALSLPIIELILTNGSLASISESFWYEEGPWPRNIFVGFLFAIAAFLLAYNGTTEAEMLMGKVAAASAIGIAMFPCACGDMSREILPKAHVVSASLMFGVLTWFCFTFIKRARAKGHREARIRASIYGICGIGMVISILMLLASSIRELNSSLASLVFWGEAVGLVSFGISWLTASRVLPWITQPWEREDLVVFSGHHQTGRSSPGDDAKAQR